MTYKPSEPAGGGTKQTINSRRRPSVVNVQSRLTNPTSVYYCLNHFAIMAILDKLVFVVCLSSIVSARTIRNTEEIQVPRIYPAFSQDDTYAAASTHQELPRIEVVPFNVPEPSDELRPPQENSPVTFLEVPAPATDLTAPSDTLWNPENNPIFFYELPVSLTKLDTPTHKFPKKYNQDIHSKDKTHSSRPKIEIELIPIEGRELVEKQKQLDKKFENLAKLENQKELEILKAQQDV